jgi:aromatic ring-opening dioxygenase catalytic subunit (LigB family)
VTPGTFPTLFVPHGAGPCFFMEWEPAGTWDRMRAWLQNIVKHAGARPSALLVVSGHWEEPAVTVNAAESHNLLYDYSGFPNHTYEIEWPAKGSPELAGQVRSLLDLAGLESAETRTRGLDHGVFVPMKVAFPVADVPIVQLSLKSGLDPEAHLAVGRALAPLRHKGVLIIGSGMSFHNMRRFSFSGGAPDAASQAFDDWLVETVSAPRIQREERLRLWANAPGGRTAHPREEHLLPLHVVAGAALEDPGERVLRDEVLGSVQSAFRFGQPISQRSAS